MKFVLREKRRMEQTIKQLRNWNDSLEKMTSRLQQERMRRRLRTRLSTNDTVQLEHTREAAAILQHYDIELMATARKVIEQGYHSEDSAPSPIVATPSSENSQQISEYQLKVDQLHFQGIPYRTDQIRAMATYKGTYLYKRLSSYAKILIMLIYD